MHEMIVEDERGDVVDLLPFCSDSCHRAYAGERYAGWNGANELEHTDYCAACGVVIPCDDGTCDCQMRNVVVNRFRTEDGEQCDHGHWIQVPASYLTPMGGM